MAGMSRFELHHDFPRLARDAGFIFETRKDKVVVNWNDIKVIDIKRIINERDFVVIDENLTKVLDYELEKEFDLRILDTGFVKLFRLSQLSVEYLMQCRKLLDRSIISLREQMKEMTEETEYMKKMLRAKEEEIRKLKNKSRKHQKAVLKTNDISSVLKNIVKSENLSGRYVGNDASLDIFQKCSFCDKVFLNQFYLQSHLQRRHPNQPSNNFEQNILSPTKKFDNEILLQEIKELKERLNETEKRLNTSEDTIDNNLTNVVGVKANQDIDAKEDKIEKELMEKDTQALILFESWKKNEVKIFEEKINNLHKQLQDVIKESSQLKENIEKSKIKEENKELLKMKEILQKQEDEITLLKDKSKQKFEQETLEINRRLEEQEKIWKVKLKETEDEHKKNTSDTNNKMNALVIDSKALQEQYTSRIELLEKQVSSQKMMLEVQTKKLKDLQQEKSYFLNSNNPVGAERKYNQLKKEGVGESTETLPPYSEGSLENIPTKEINKDTTLLSPKKSMENDTSQIINNKAKIVQNHPSNQNSDDDEICEMPVSNSQLSSGKMNKKKDIKMNNSPKHVTNKSSPVKNVSLMEDPAYTKSKNAYNSWDSDDLKEFALPSPKPRDKSSTSKMSLHRTPQRNSQRDFVLKAVKDDLVVILNKRLEQMGIPENHRAISKQFFQTNMRIVKNEEALFTKKYQHYKSLRKKIANILEVKIDEIQEKQIPLPRHEIHKSSLSVNKVGTLLNNVKTKALMKFKDMKDRTYNKENTSNKLELRVGRHVGGSGKKEDKPNDSLPEKVSAALIVQMANDIDGKSLYNNIDSKVTSSSSDLSSESSDEDVKGDHKRIVTTALYHAPSTSSLNITNSPIKRPFSKGILESSTPTKNGADKKQSEDLSELDDRKMLASNITKSEEDILSMYTGATSTSDDTSDIDDIVKSQRIVSKDSVASDKNAYQRSVLKNTPSNNALSKKKVLFDLDSNQVKSRSASPSISSGTTDVRRKEELPQRHQENANNYDLIVDNIENDIPTQTLVRDEHRFQPKQSPKVAEISTVIMRQLEKRNSKPPVNSVDTLNVRTVSSTQKEDSSQSTIDDEFKQKSYDLVSKEGALPKPAPRIQKTTSIIDTDLELSDWSIDDFLMK